MALIGNGVRYGSTNPSRTASGVASVYAASVAGAITPGSRRCWFDSTATAGAAPKQAGMPSGYGHPGAWVLPQRAGGMASRGIVTGVGLVSGAPLVSSTPLAATMAGTGTVADAACAVVIALAAALQGSGALTASLSGGVQLAATLAGQGSLTAALSVLAGLVAALPGTGSVTANLKGYAGLEADLLPYTDLSPQGLAAAVWNSLAAASNTTGTMGELLNAAGSGGLASEFQTILRELSILAGLDPTKPLVVTATSRTAGDIEQTITDASGTVMVTRT